MLSLLSNDSYHGIVDPVEAPTRSKVAVPLLLMPAVLASVAPFGIDLYLSAFPAHGGGPACQLS
jgi:hypothetical protein